MQGVAQEGTDGLGERPPVHASILGGAEKRVDEEEKKSGMGLE